MVKNIDGLELMAQSKYHMGYSRWMEDEQRYEKWEQHSIPRVMNMHRQKFADIMTPELEALISEAQEAYRDKAVLGAQRTLQFGGEQIFKHNARLYNCCSTYIDRSEVFSEIFYLLLCGVGVGFSVQRHHIEKLPTITRRSAKRVKVFTIPDSIEGWADSIAVLLSSYFTERTSHPEYHGCQVHFDFSKIRPKGSKISGGFKAPGPEGLRTALLKCEQLLEEFLSKESIVKINSITAYDLVMHISDAVLSGGVRRSATICVFDKNDEDMLNAKVGNWQQENPQRGRSNNSAMIVRDEITREEWSNIISKVKNFGEPGFIFASSNEHMVNPCVEIGMLPKVYLEEEKVWKSGFQFCNLVEVNGGKCNTKEKLFAAVRAGSILATLQAAYTDFKYVSEVTRLITEKEALIGVSITGWMNNPEVLFDPAVLVEAAGIVKEVNKMVAKIIGINPAARTTCAKPAGTTSILLKTASGAHPEHSPRYFRNMQVGRDDEVLQLIKKANPLMVEKSVWSKSGLDDVISFPIVAKPGSMFKSSLYGKKHLEYIKIAQQNWVEAGTDVDLCVDPTLRHNISNTISVDNWDEVEQYLFDNRDSFAGVSLLGIFGDKDYPQAPFTEVFTTKEIVKKYGDGSLFASGLIVDALHAFNKDLWVACNSVLYEAPPSDDVLQRDWTRRAIKFANNYFKGDVKEMTYCLKDCYNLHKWESMLRVIKPVDFDELKQQTFVDIDTMGSQACAGGACEISF